MGQTGLRTTVFSDDDDLFEELTNKALQIDAVKDDQGAMEINLKVDPNVELNSLTLKIPSPTQESKINVTKDNNESRKNNAIFNKENISDEIPKTSIQEEKTHKEFYRLPPIKYQGLK